MSDVILTVDSAYGEQEIEPPGRTGAKSHPAGTVVTSYPLGTAVTISIKKRTYDEERVLGGWLHTKWTKVWTCTGFTGTGDAPKEGRGTSARFVIQKDSSIKWNWVSQNQIGAQVTSIIAFIAVLAIALAGYYSWHRPFVVAISAGALGGLLHEIVQSGGKYVLPNCDESGNFVLGGLIGIVTGGTAGLLLYQGLLGTPPVVVDAKLAVGALLAGLAVKGIADAPNPK